jgi:hypothetical protein
MKKVCSRLKTNAGFSNIKGFFTEDFLDKEHHKVGSDVVDFFDENNRATLSSIMYLIVFYNIFIDNPK